MEHVKVEVVKEWKPPKNVRAVWKFVGFCNFYCCFIKGFLKLPDPYMTSPRRISHGNGPC
jgi:hypothetical protein